MGPAPDSVLPSQKGLAPSPHAVARALAAPNPELPAQLPVLLT